MKLWGMVPEARTPRSFEATVFENPSKPAM
jgi:hypothetical protein